MAEKRVFVSNRDSISSEVSKRIAKVLLAVTIGTLGAVMFFNSGTFKPRHTVTEKSLAKSVVMSNLSPITDHNQSKFVESITIEDCGVVYNNEFITLGDTIDLKTYNLQYEEAIDSDNSVGLFYHESKSFEVIGIGNLEDGYKIWSIHTTNSEVRTSRGAKLLDTKESLNYYYPEVFNWKGYQEFEVSNAVVGFTFQSGLFVEYWVSYK